MASSSTRTSLASSALRSSSFSDIFPEHVAVNIGWIVYDDCVRDTARVRVVADALLEFFRVHESMFVGGPAQGACRPLPASRTSDL